MEKGRENLFKIQDSNDENQCKLFFKTCLEMKNINDLTENENSEERQY